MRMCWKTVRETHFFILAFKDSMIVERSCVRVLTMEARCCLHSGRL